VTLVAIPGQGLWLPWMPGGVLRTSVVAGSSALVLDADQEEVQMIGSLMIDGGGTKTFGTSGAALDWRPATPITFEAGCTLTVGIKLAAQIETATGPVAHATPGAAAFAVSRALVGGSDTIPANTWRSDAMTTGTPCTLADGDLVALCWHLAVTAGSPAVRVRAGSLSSPLGAPLVTLVTAGPTYTEQLLLPNVLLHCNDGTLAWLFPSWVYAVDSADSGTIGADTVAANVFEVPFPCAIDAVAASVKQTTNAADLAFTLYGTPLGTPSVLASISQDANVTGAVNSFRTYFRRFAAAQPLTPGTPYAIGVHQTTATAVAVTQYEVADPSHFRPSGLDETCYAALSAGGATFAPVNAGKCRYAIWVHVSHLDDGASGAAPGAYSTALRHARAQTLIDTLGAAAELRLYDAEDTLLATVLLASPVGTDTDGTLTFTATTAGTVVTSGTATRATICDESGTPQVTGLTVSGSGGSGHLKLATVSAALTEGEAVRLTAFTILQGNT
jgi:hypothetical protein